MTEHLTTHQAEVGTCNQAIRIIVDERGIGSWRRGPIPERIRTLYKARVEKRAV